LNPQAGDFESPAATCRPHSNLRGLCIAGRPFPDRCTTSTVSTRRFAVPGPLVRWNSRKLVLSCREKHEINRAQFAGIGPVGALGAIHPRQFRQTLLGGRPTSVYTSAVGIAPGNPHPAPMADDLARHLIALSCPHGGTVLDPFMGSGTTALVARKLGRRSIGIELSPEYATLCAERLQQQSLFAGEAA
jgi:hypothetical protein